MKLKDLPKNSDITSVKIKLSEKMFNEFKEYAGPEDTDEVYIVGNIMMDFFISTNAPVENKERRLYPLPPSVFPKDFLECEIVTT